MEDVVRPGSDVAPHHIPPTVLPLETLEAPVFTGFLACRFAPCSPTFPSRGQESKREMGQKLPWKVSLVYPCFSFALETLPPPPTSTPVKGPAQWKALALAAVFQ